MELKSGYFKSPGKVNLLLEKDDTILSPVSEVVVNVKILSVESAYPKYNKPDSL